MANESRSRKQSGLPATDYFAPYFVIEVEGREVRPERRADVTEVKVTLGIEELASCVLTLSNWDQRQGDFRTDFEIGRAVKIQMGYADYFTTMFYGQVTRLAPRFPEAGQPTLTVTCLDGLVKLKDRQPKDGESRKYENKTDVEIARQIADRHGMGFVGPDAAEQSRLGLGKHPLVWQKNQDDAAFLIERASRIDFDCFVVHSDQKQKDTLCFVPPSDGRGADHTQVYTLEYQKNLTSFTTQADVSEQVAKVTVRGWDPATKKTLTGQASVSDLPGSGKGKTGPDLVKQHFGDKEAIVEHPVASAEEARQLAQSLLRNRAYEFLTGEGQMIGLPNLRPGHNLEIAKIGRFSGTYYVKSCEHTIGDKGYTTSFKVRKLALGEGSSS